ncbi:hypothetical protein [Hymenobacter algoricola]|uniref:Uncharacterized protein n=1 Tax=Hymenobacter algoricola TaxID=486267 RepID=A0ABP7N9K7_9BACT
MATTSPRLRFTLDSEELGRLVVDVEEDPIGWEQLGLQLHRDAKLHGLTTEYSVQLGFVKRAKQYLERMDELRGIEASVTLTIEQYDPNSFLFIPYYTGRLAFRAKQRTALEFRCNVENAGFTQQFLNQTDKQVDLFKAESLSGTVLPTLAPVFAELHSKAIIKRYAGQVEDTALVSPANYVTDGESRFQNLYFGVGTPTDDEFGIGVLPFGPVVRTSGVDHSEVPIFVTKEAGPFSFDFNLLSRLLIKQGVRQFPILRSLFHRVDVTYFLRINLDAPVVLATVGDDVDESDYSRDVLLRYQGTLPLEIGDEVYVYGLLNVHDIEYDRAGPGYSFEVSLSMQPGSAFRIEAQTTTEPSPCAGLLAYEALERICQAATDQPQAFRSDFFGRTDTASAYAQDGEGSLTFVTGGFQLRGFPLDKKPLTASWKTLFESSLAQVYWLGMGIEKRADGQEVVRVEPAPYFYSDEVVVDFTEPTETKANGLEDYHFNTLELGYQKWQTEQVNGLDEFNARREWALPITQAKNSYSVLCSAVTAGFYLENTRRKRFDASSSTDTASDNDSFLICLLRQAGGGFESERNQRFAQLSGILSPETVYNARLSPARLLRRHAPAFGAGLRHELLRLVRFTFGEGNNEFVSRLATEAQSVVEKGDVRVADLPAPIWLPESYEIKPAMRAEQVAALLANPRGRVRFRNEAGHVCEGWVLDFKHILQEQKGDFTLLRAAQLTALTQ